MYVCVSEFLCTCMRASVLCLRLNHAWVSVKASILSSFPCSLALCVAGLPFSLTNFSPCKPFLPVEQS